MASKPIIKITMLGKFEIAVNGEPVLPQLAQSRKAMLLVQYLLLEHGRRVPHKELTDALWPGETSGNPDMALRAILHRFRGMVDDCGAEELANCVITNRGSYQWNPALDCEIDIYTMQNLLEHARYEGDPTACERIYEEVLELYTGKLLPASAGEGWVERRSVGLHSQYQSTLFSLLELYKKRGDYARIITVCRRAAEIDPYDEHLQMELVMALEESGQTREAQRVSRDAAGLGYRHMGTRRPRELNNSYLQLMQADCHLESDIDEIRNSMEKEDRVTGAFVCDYPTFREIYQLHFRLQERYGTPLFLALLTIASPTSTPDPTETAAVMETLEGVLCDALRRCDVLARYSATQYVVLLAGVNNDTGLNPLERVKQDFYNKPEHAGYVLSYRLRAPEVKRAGRNTRHSRTTRKKGAAKKD